MTVKLIASSCRQCWCLMVWGSERRPALLCPRDVLLSTMLAHGIRTRYCHYAWRRFLCLKSCISTVWIFHCTCLFCVQCYFVYLHVACSNSFLHLLILSITSFMVSHMWGFLSYKNNVALFFSSRMVHECMDVLKWALWTQRSSRFCYILYLVLSLPQALCHLQLVLRHGWGFTSAEGIGRLIQPPAQDSQEELSGALL